jgi:1-acyl-sn-glycerol-3-phosphate acyltransferase
MSRRGEIGARVAHVVGIALFRSLYRVKTPGREHVPEAGPVLLAVNHTAFIDGPLVVGVAGRPVHVLSKAELFHGVLGFALRSIGQIPVHRASADREALLVGLDVLSKGGVLAVFPEGSRGAGDFTDVRAGLAWLALRSGAPVVPVICLGTAHGTTTVAGLPRPRAHMAAVFGEPFTVKPTDGWTAGRTALAAAEADVRERLLAHHAYAHGLAGPWQVRE